MNKNIVAGVGIVLALILGVLGVTKTSTNTTIQKNVGAVAGPDMPYPYLSVNGVRQWYGKTSFTTSVSSTTCSIQAPAGTSTLVSASMSFTRVGSTTDAEIGIDAGNGATTTLISRAMATPDVLIGTQTYVVASSTASQLVVPSNYYVNFKTGGGGTAGTLSPKFEGTCIATFQEVQ